MATLNSEALPLNGPYSSTLGTLNLQEQQLLARIREIESRLQEVSLNKKNSDLAEDNQKVQSPKGRLLVISNRAPVTITRKGDEWMFRGSSGGLVSGLAGLQKTNFIWIGWPGIDIPMDQREIVTRRLLDEQKCLPVYMNDQLADTYYNGFCNQVLWPLFHYVPLMSFHKSDIDEEKKFNSKLWKAYEEANRIFCDAVMNIYQDGDLVWVHDYHLMLLPAMLRNKVRTMNIGFFLHIPFPTHEVYRVLPWRTECLEGMLNADLLGFHTFDYARHFLAACTCILGWPSDFSGVQAPDGRKAAIGIFPIGIEPQQFLTALTTKAVKQRAAELEERFAGKKILIGVDRLDYIKGMPHKLLALENLLTRYPEWKGSVVLIQVAIPSRVTVDEYRDLCSEVNALVGRINSQFGTLEYSPVSYINQSVNFTELCALYSVADAMVITSLRDGMNLVAQEYVVCQLENRGNLIISEFAGSAQCLSTAVRINPWNITATADALHQVLSMTRLERQIRHQVMFRYVTTHTSASWGETFLSELIRMSTVEAEKDSTVRFLDVPLLVAEYKAAKNRVILLDYDGTLCAFHANPALALPSKALLDFLDIIGNDPRNALFLVSGRDRQFLFENFGHLAVGLAAEHGCFLRYPAHLQADSPVCNDSAAAAMYSSSTVAPQLSSPSSSSSDLPRSMPQSPRRTSRTSRSDGIWEFALPVADFSWKKDLLGAFKMREEQVPGSMVEEKEAALCWHYRDATDPQFAAWHAKELHNYLAEALVNVPAEVLLGNKVIEARHCGVHKGAIVERVIQDRSFSLDDSTPVDFVLCIGDDRTDEDMFAALLPQQSLDSVFTCTVGRKTTQAKYYVPTFKEVLQVLQLLADLSSDCVLPLHMYQIEPAYALARSRSTPEGLKASIFVKSQSMPEGLSDWMPSLSEISEDIVPLNHLT